MDKCVSFLALMNFPGDDTPIINRLPRWNGALERGEKDDNEMGRFCCQEAGRDFWILQIPEPERAIEASPYPDANSRERIPPSPVRR